MACGVHLGTSSPRCNHTGHCQYGRLPPHSKLQSNTHPDRRVPLQAACRAAAPMQAAEACPRLGPAKAGRGGGDGQQPAGPRAQHGARLRALSLLLLLTQLLPLSLLLLPLLLRACLAAGLRAHFEPALEDPLCRRRRRRLLPHSAPGSGCRSSITVVN